MLFGLCKFVWIIDLLVTRPNPHLRALARLFIPEVLWTKERTPTPYPSIDFTFGLEVESIKEFGGVSIGLWWLCICVLGFVFSTSLFWKDMFFKLKGAHICFSHAYVQYKMAFFFIPKEIHLFFENLTVIGISSLHALLMDIHHDTFLRSILGDDFISLAFRTHICSYSGKGPRLWLIARPSIRSFHIAHFTFTSMLRFHFNLI